MYRRIIKPVFDFLTGFLLLVLFSPVMILTTLLLFIIYGGSPFFVQPRPGKMGRIFRLIKFRTMNRKKDEKGNLLKSNLRITPIGHFLRAASIDELPQLINVLKGDMSMVGPRPLRVEYLPHYSEQQALRHHVKPGITGWAQVNGRNSLSWEERFEMDVWYVNHVSLGLDLKILLRTILKVFKKEGINQDDTTTMEPFKGVKLNG